MPFNFGLARTSRAALRSETKDGPRVSDPSNSRIAIPSSSLVPMINAIRLFFPHIADNVAIHFTRSLSFCPIGYVTERDRATYFQAIRRRWLMAREML
jgi:hypothetical protein